MSRCVVWRARLAGLKLVRTLLLTEEGEKTFKGSGRAAERQPLRQRPGGANTSGCCAVALWLPR